MVSSKLLSRELTADELVVPVALLSTARVKGVVELGLKVVRQLAVDKFDSVDAKPLTPLHHQGPKALVRTDHEPSRCDHRLDAVNIV